MLSKLSATALLFVTHISMMPLTIRWLYIYTRVHQSKVVTTKSTYEPSHGKNNILDSASSIDSDQSKHAAQANPDRYCSPSVSFLFQESLLYTFISQRRNVSARICLIGMCRLIWVDTFSRCHNVGYLVERVKCNIQSMAILTLVIFCL